MTTAQARNEGHGLARKGHGGLTNTPRRLAHMARDSGPDARRGRAKFRRLLAELFDRGFPRDPFAW
jgi:hypothetical protein